MVEPTSAAEPEVVVAQEEEPAEEPEVAVAQEEEPEVAVAQEE